MKSDAAIVVAFGKFAASGYKKSLFTKELYRELSMSFGFIAHFDRDGFYEALISSPSARANALTIMAERDLATGGVRALTPLEQLLRTMVIDRGLVDVAAKELAVETEQRERAELARLKAKYELDERLS